MRFDVSPYRPGIIDGMQFISGGKREGLYAANLATVQ